MEEVKRGRPKIIDMVNAPQKLTRRQLKDRELLLLLRKIKPHIADSILTAAKIMGDEKAQDANKLRAATLLLQQYKDLVDAVYSGKQEVEEDDDDNSHGALFSLKVVNNESQEE
jgi:hypothetical protein